MVQEDMGGCCRLNVVHAKACANWHPSHSDARCVMTMFQLSKELITAPLTHAPPC
jgi:hypothetical protein